MKNLIILAFLLITSTVVFAQKKQTPVAARNPVYSNGLFRNVDGTYFDFQEGVNTASAFGSLNVLDWLQGRVAGLQVYSINGTRVAFIRNAPATIFLDEIRVDHSFLHMLPVADIAMIKVIKTPVVSAMSGPGGAIAIYTKRGEGGEE